MIQKQHKYIPIILNAANEYERNLSNKNIIFIYELSEKSYGYIECLFRPHNFLHLTGVELIDNSLSSNQFYKKCIDKKLSLKDFKLREDGTTILKISVLHNLMQIQKTSKMIGDYNGSKPKLYADKLLGNVNACLGFKKLDYYYIPITTLNQDIRDLIYKPSSRILLTYTKNYSDLKYKDNTYIAKKFDIEKIRTSKEISEKIIM